MFLDDKNHIEEQFIILYCVYFLYRSIAFLCINV